MEEAEGKRGTHSPARSLAQRSFTQPSAIRPCQAQGGEEGFFATLGRIWGFSEPNPLRRSLVERISGAWAEISRVFRMPFILWIFWMNDIHLSGNLFDLTPDVIVVITKIYLENSRLITLLL